MGHVNLANLLFQMDEPELARAHYETALRIDPEHRHAHRGMGNFLAECGDEAGARRHRDKAFKNNFLTPLPYRGDRSGIAVLLLVSAAGGNIPTSTLLDDRYFRTHRAGDGVLRPENSAAAARPGVQQHRRC